MEMENIKLFSDRFELSESEDDPEVLIGKFIICDFLPNKNFVQLNRETIEDWLSTLVNKPLVGKIITTATKDNDGNFIRDFSGHNVVLVTKTDDFGQEYQDV